MTRSLALALALLPPTAGCLPGVTARGSVSSVSADCASVDAVPLPKARVAVHCPNRHDPVVEVSTDVQGRFELRDHALVPSACWVRVSAPEHDDAVYPIDHLCAVEGTVVEGCHGLSVQAELERRASPAPEDDADDSGPND